MCSNTPSTTTPAPVSSTSSKITPNNLPVPPLPRSEISARTEGRRAPPPDIVGSAFRNAVPTYAKRHTSSVKRYMYLTRRPNVREFGDTLRIPPSVTFGEFLDLRQESLP